MQRRIILLILITLLAGFLRFWQVTSVPPSLYWDEVSQGFNAYSLLMTGRDEHQELLPVARFIAFGDYKAPVNIYLTVPSLAVFGKTTFAVRFPSALLGTLTVFFVFFLVRYLFVKDKNRDWFGLSAAFLLVISPWHIQLSRAAYEGNIATFFTVFALFLFFYSLHAKRWLFILSVVSFVIAFYSFNAHRVFIPLLVIMLGIVFFRELWMRKGIIVSGVGLGIILLIPFLIYFQTPESKLRFNEVNIFSEIATVEKANILIRDEESTLFAKIIHNRRVLFAREYVSNYFDFFNPTYLFIRGDINPRFSDRFNGQLYMWMIPLLLVGVYRLFIKRDKGVFVLLAWFFLAPLGAATARETPHALRSETFIPLYEIVAGIGFVTAYTFVKKISPKLHKIALLGGSGVALFSVMSFWHNYMVHNPILYSSDWQYGYEQVVKTVEKLKGDYTTIYMTTTYGRPSIYVAWYSDLAPQEYWGKVKSVRDPFGFYNVESVGKYVFTEKLPDNVEDNALFVMLPDQVPVKAKVIETVTFLNGEPAFVIATL